MGRINFRDVHFSLVKAARPQQSRLQDRGLTAPRSGDTGQSVVAGSRTRHPAAGKRALYHRNMALWPMVRTRWSPNRALSATIVVVGLHWPDVAKTDEPPT
jgi:hypothetical protein